VFNDLGSGTNAYGTISGWTVSGNGTCNGCAGNSFTAANLFTAAGSGNELLSEIDLAVGNANSTLNTFYASIWSDDLGAPGVQLPNAYWSLSTSTAAETCCALVSINGISGVTLTGGTQYFMVLGPLSITDTSYNIWALNNQGVTGDDQISINGAPWVDNGPQTLGAFDVLSGTVPEPSTFVLLGGGIALLGFCKRGVNRDRLYRTT
jgi:hypothetical protein